MITVTIKDTELSCIALACIEGKKLILQTHDTLPLVHQSPITVIYDDTNDEDEYYVIQPMWVKESNRKSIAFKDNNNWKLVIKKV